MHLVGSVGDLQRNARARIKQTGQRRVLADPWGRAVRVQMARLITQRATSGATTLIAGAPTPTASSPTVSISQAGLQPQSRLFDADAFGRPLRTTPCSATARPKVCRCKDR